MSALRLQKLFPPSPSSESFYITLIASLSGNLDDYNLCFRNTGSGFSGTIIAEAKDSYQDRHRTAVKGLSAIKKELAELRDGLAEVQIVKEKLENSEAILRRSQVYTSLLLSKSSYLPVLHIYYILIIS